LRENKTDLLNLQSWYYILVRSNNPWCAFVVTFHYKLDYSNYPRLLKLLPKAALFISFVPR